MDTLEKLKKHWKSTSQEMPKLSYEEIYNMLLKKSSSVLKWILIISVAELLFWISILFIIPDQNIKIMQDMGVDTILNYANYLHFFIVGVFIYLFYKNYKNIQVTDTTKGLMKNILKARQTVRYFVYYNIGMFIVTSIALNTFFYKNSDQLYEVMDFAEKGVPKEGFANFYILTQIIAGVVILGLLLLFYWILYGFLLKRLKRNYKELEKIEN
jgi:hypothetical protein